jgi:carbamate kinase
MLEPIRQYPGLKDPTKFIGPVYSEADADRFRVEKGWIMKKDAYRRRRVVVSPLPKLSSRFDPSNGSPADSKSRVKLHGGVGDKAKKPNHPSPVE